jgi:adenine-specific DNA-methyltransferase
MKERNLIPNELFNENLLGNILKNFTLENDNYYKAILQNLFFATLNTKQEERRFRSDKRGFKGYNTDFGNHNVYRYENLFKNSEEAIEKYFLPIPFLNGGLFECLDYKSKNKEERKYIDGFTDLKKYQPSVPNYLFFTDEEIVDLSEDYNDKKYKKTKVKGLIKILSQYNFTIDENEPDDVEIALDPELLGEVFENLLASYNPETATTARKATGSYYTPREIVDYMVDESLKEYFKTHIPEIEEEKLNKLFAKEDTTNPFDIEKSVKLINLIDALRIVDPAVGSGVFPMRVLSRLVFLLHKLDPDNSQWKNIQIEGVLKSVKDPILQKELINQVEKRFKEKNPDYGRKLYLIEKCIYGVDIQQIAVEIAKLRFFISLLVDEAIDFDKKDENYGIEPLPNLDFKIMQGNSLISSFYGIYFKQEPESKGMLFELDERHKQLISEFEELKSQYQNEPDVFKKQDLRKKIDEKIVQIFEEKLNEHLPEIKQIEEKASQLPKREDKDRYIKEEKEKLFKKLGFDLEKAKEDLTAYTEGRKEKNFFLWDIYFAEVFAEKGGFDIVIGNPPYGNILDKDINKNTKKFVKKNFKYSTPSDISSPFIETGFNLLKEKGNLVFIITYAITFNKNFSKSRELLSKNFERVLIYTFDRDRCRTFKSMTQSVSILKCFNKNAPVKEGIYTSRMYRETPDINSIEVTNCNGYLLPKNSNDSQSHRLPKIGEKINRQILEKLLQFNHNVGSIIKNNGSKIWIRTSGNYWYNAFDRKPYNSVDITSLYVDENFADFLILLMNSSLFYFWFRIYGDGRHMNMDILDSFPIPSREKILRYKILLAKMENRFMNKLFSVFDKKHNRFITSNIKSEIDLIDLILGKYFYNLDHEEIIHILNYDYEVRRGCKIDKPFYILINQILSAKKQNPEADTSQLEKEIDQLVYKLYDLTEEEIKIIES